jgi:hypothetical protein
MSNVTRGALFFCLGLFAVIGVVAASTSIASAEEGDSSPDNPPPTNIAPLTIEENIPDTNPGGPLKLIPPTGVMFSEHALAEKTLDRDELARQIDLRVRARDITSTRGADTEGMQDMHLRLMGGLFAVDDIISATGTLDDQNQISQVLAYFAARHMLRFAALTLWVNYRVELSRAEGRSLTNTEFGNFSPSLEQLHQWDLRNDLTQNNTQTSTLALNRLAFDFDFGRSFPLAISLGKQDVDWAYSGMGYGVLDPFNYAGIELVAPQDIFRPDSFGHDMLRFRYDLSSDGEKENVQPMASVAEVPEIVRPKLPAEGRFAGAQRFSRVAGAQLAALKYEIPVGSDTDAMFTVISRERGRFTPGLFMVGAGARMYVDRAMFWMEGLVGEQRAPTTKLGAWAIGAGVQLTEDVTVKFEMQWKSTFAFLSVGFAKSYLVGNVVWRIDENVVLQATTIFNQIDESAQLTLEATYKQSQYLHFMVGLQQHFGNLGDEFGDTFAHDNYLFFRAVYQLPLGLKRGETESREGV